MSIGTPPSGGAAPAGVALSGGVVPAGVAAADVAVSAGVAPTDADAAMHPPAPESFGGETAVGLASSAPLRPEKMRARRRAEAARASALRRAGTRMPRRGRTHAALSAIAAVAVAVLLVVTTGSGASGHSPDGTTIPRSSASAVPASIAAATHDPDAGSWAWPVPPPHPVVGPFRAPATAYSAGHRGIDIGAPDGTAVLAPNDGVVHFAGVVVDRPVLSITQDDGVLTSLEPVASDLVAGQRVARGEPVGVLIPGHCGAPCLHLGARVDGAYLSPLRWLGGVPRAVLLPMSGG